ncbi:hypothetical protein [Streptomyces sp. F001]|uniref:hypothetical protein n=1 Tax=Streptomyces sp. F001 TaxID=1510026 RepID=UPI001F0D6CED|nr:hypothetical protein [Streptomyces sp. F001]
MTESGGRRRTAWRWGMAVWVVTVAFGGGLTLWLQDSAEPPEPYGRQESSPAPTPLSEEEWNTACLRPTPPPDENTVYDYACVIKAG